MPPAMKCKHEWQVYSTALCPPSLMVWCKGCGKAGYVEQPQFTQADWEQAFYAPSNPHPLRPALSKHVKFDK